MNRLLVLGIGCLLAMGCQSTLQPTTDFDSSADFSRFRTFSWIDPNPLVRAATQRPLNPLVVQRLMADTREVLTGRGLPFVDNPAEADLAVAFTIGSRDGIQITSFPSNSFHRGPAGRRDHRWRGGYWGTSSTVQTRNYTEGQLAIDLFDVAGSRPVWHGTVSRRITRSERVAPGDALREAVEAILGEFPPG